MPNTPDADAEWLRSFAHELLIAYGPWWSNGVAVQERLCKAADRLDASLPIAVAERLPDAAKELADMQATFQVGHGSIKVGALPAVDRDPRGNGVLGVCE